MMDRLKDQAVLFVPCRSAEMVSCNRLVFVGFLQLGPQQVGEQVVIAVPVPLIVQGH